MAAGVTYYFGFDLAVDASGFSLVITRGAYTYTITVADFATTTFYHPLSDADGYTGFAAALQVAIRAEGVALGDPQAADWVISWTHSTMHLTLYHPTGAFTATLSTDAQHVLGMAATLASDVSQNSTVRPYYVIRPAVQATAPLTKKRGDYESPGSAPDEEETDDGDAAGVLRSTFGVWRDLQQLYEPKAACLPLSATAAVPWTWWHAFKHTRITHPILIVIAPVTQSTITYVAADVQVRVKLRADGALWSPEWYVSNLDSYQHIPLKLRVIERLAD